MDAQVPAPFTVKQEDRLRAIVREEIAARIPVSFDLQDVVHSDELRGHFAAMTKAAAGAAARAARLGG